MISVERDVFLRKIQNFPAIMKFIDIEKVDKKNSEHPLLWYLKCDDENLERFLNYFTNCLDMLLSIKESIMLDVENLKNKLSNSPQFHNTLCEIEWLIRLYKKGILKEVEPKLGERNPDFKIMINQKEYYVEIFSKHFSASYEICDIIENRLKDRTDKMNLDYETNIVIRDKFSRSEIRDFTSLILERISEPMNFIYENRIEGHFFKDRNYKEWNNVNEINSLRFIIENPDKYNEYWESWKNLIARICYSQDKTHGCVTANPEYEPNLKESLYNKIKEKLEKYINVPFICIIDLSRFHFDTIADRILLSDIISIIDKKTGMQILKFTSMNELFKNYDNLTCVIVSRRKRNNNKFIIDSQVFRNPNAKHPLTFEEAQLFGEVMN